MARAVTPKDRGWSWVILASSFAVCAVMSSMYTSGIFYVIFLELFEKSKSTTAWTTSLQPSVQCLLSPLVGVIYTRLGGRALVMAGGFCIFCGFFLTFFCQSIPQILITYGILVGVGMSLAYIPPYVILGFYFEKYRNIVYGLVNSAAGLAMFVYGPVTQICIDHFGWRGTMWIFAGVHLQICICGAVLRPPVREVTVKQITKESAPSTRPKPPRQKNCLGLSHVLCPNLVCLGMSTMLCSCGISVVYAHLPSFAQLYGSTAVQAATLMSFCGVGNIVGRLASGFLITVPHVGIFPVHITASVLAAASSILLNIIGGNFPGQITCSLLVATFGNVYMPLLAPGVIDIIGLDSLSSGLSIAVFLMGIGFMAGPPVAGWLFDMTGAYNYSFYFSGLCYLAGALFVIPILYTRKRKAQSAETPSSTTPAL